MLTAATSHDPPRLPPPRQFSSSRNQFAEAMAKEITIEVVRRDPFTGFIASDSMTVAKVRGWVLFWSQFSDRWAR